LQAIPVKSNGGAKVPPRSTLGAVWT